jgi:hypothetical protein
MKKLLWLPVFLFFVHFSFAQQKLMSPKEFLGYELGDRFTRHHKVMEYYKHVAEVMPNVDLVQYGETYEYRPLVYAVVTSPENFKKLEQIRQDNLKRTGLSEGSASADKKAIVWLSYNVHGNEANSLEASMWTLYELANPANASTQEWIKNSVVILDPCINPDGRDRYANFYNQYGNIPANTSGDAKEHREPWPGGRANHYLFDLNRDWAWQTQIESKQRIKVYHQWLPHVHVDFHEQGHNNPYFFAPAAEPFHEVISPWQREFQTMIGKNNAKYFDEQGWLYFTKEVFDLYYPSYGDTYPTYNGAIGMTYEQAGGGFGGLSITTETGDPLTLRDRLTHHHTTGLSTVEITSKMPPVWLTSLKNIFVKTAILLQHPIKRMSSNRKTILIRLPSWRHGSIPITFSMAILQQEKQEEVTTIRHKHKTILHFPQKILIVNIYQPKSRFITTLFEPQSKLPIHSPMISPPGI